MDESRPSAPRAISELIREIVKKRLRDVNVDQVIVEEGEDHDGDPVLWVTVVADAEVDALDPATMVDMVRHIRPRLLEAGETRFPMVSYMTKEDYQSIGDEAA